jgi:glucuronoarabinoxylan endo-1,4-beta-xylanase
VAAASSLADAGAQVGAGDCLITWTNLHQRMDGFGASSAWRRDWTEAQADMFFSTNRGVAVAEDGTEFGFTGIGLSLLRTRIASDGSTLETNIMQMARDREVRVWSAPWSPPAVFKDSGSLHGGRFVSRPEHHLAYAEQLADYAATMRDAFGVALYALSIQNEPDRSEEYESCEWTGRQLHAFVPILRAALDARGLEATRLMLPEPSGWQFALAAEVLADPATAAMADILAAHSYGTSAAPVPAHGKALWMTEDSLLEGSDSSMDNGLLWAGEIHDFLTVAQVNAWHYWWLISGNEDGNEGLADTNAVPARRMYVLGNYSRFVRPGFYRMEAANAGAARISAYRSRWTGAFAVVAINDGDAAIEQTIRLAGGGGGITAVTPWITSASLSLSNQPPVAVTNGMFTYALPARSVATFAGRAPTPYQVSVVTAARNAQGHFEVSVDGLPGPDLTLMRSSNLTAWTPVLTTNAPALPAMLIDAGGTGDPLRVYRVRLEP